ncbi:MAG: hypothetical protein EAZ86_28195 [Oscillatoriales cyanobacterium]|nr:MAG: hypothetical protein EAZ86_28195 [Oscillatoriales cyanobacterium]TAG61254.1 MAG: hypothetical protein EAZ28_04790 [Oscillatoriales cyanobacterium]
MIKNNYISGAAGFGSGACACATNAGWAERQGGKDRATPTRIAGKSIVIYYMTREALSPSPFAFTSSGLTRLG